MNRALCHAMLHATGTLKGYLDYVAM